MEKAKISKSMVAIRPTAKPEVAFVYRSEADIKNLILFVGSNPVLTPDLTLKFKKIDVPTGSVVFRNSYGEVTRIMKIEEVEAQYEIVAEADFQPKDANKVVDKPAKVKK